MQASLQNKPTFFGISLHLQIRFSEEEKAIIRHRSLHNYIFDLSPGSLSDINVHRHELYLVGSVAGFMFSFFMMIIGGAAKADALMALGLLGFLGCPVLFAYSIWKMIAQRKENESRLTIGYLLEHPYLVITTPDPKQIPTLENNLARRLEHLKGFLTQTHDLVQPRTIEL